MRPLVPLAIAAAALILCGVSTADAQKKSTRVKGHVTKDGTYVPPHMRTKPNDRVNDNWSTAGNVNPYTGKSGKKPRGPK